MARPRIAIVSPAYNEVDGIRAFAAEVARVLEPLPYDFTLLVVDDGSTDGTREVLDELQRSDPSRFGVLHLSRNFGHQAALTAGMDHAVGDAVVTMDADLQHPPALLPELIRRWEAGADIVLTIRRSTADAGFLKSLMARGFYALVNRFSTTPIAANASDFRLVSRRVADLFRNDIRERDRFLRGLVSWVGFKTDQVPFDAPARFAGQTKYSLGKMAHLAKIGMISFSKVPLKLAVLCGLATCALSFLYGLYAVIVFFFYHRMVVPGWASIILVTTFLGGAHLIFLGLIGEYIGSIFDEIKARPIYIVESSRLARAPGSGSTSEAPPSGLPRRE